MIELTETEKRIQEAANHATVHDYFSAQLIPQVYKYDVAILLNTIKTLRLRSHAMLLQVDKWRLRCRESWEESDGNFTSAFRQMQEVDRLKSLQPCGHPKACTVSDAGYMGGTGHCAWCEDIARVRKEDIENARKLTG